MTWFFVIIGASQFGNIFLVAKVDNEMACYKAINEYGPQFTAMNGIKLSFICSTDYAWSQYAYPSIDVMIRETRK